MTASETINHEITLLLKRLHNKKICPCCVATGMMYRGAFLHNDVMGAAETVALCCDIADLIEAPELPAGGTQH